jgi:hypothetical protein
MLKSVVSSMALWVAVQASAATAIQFKLDQTCVTSAGIYDSLGNLIRTLWRGETLAAGNHSVNWDDLDDIGRPIGLKTVQARLLCHRVSYHWDGVIGNTSSTFTGPGVHHAMFPPTSIAVAKQRAVYAVGYNEGQPGAHGFLLASPQVDVLPVDRSDPFTAWTFVASDGRRAYWANVGGLSHTTFVAASDFAGGNFKPFPAGMDLCLNHNGPNCYPDQQYSGVIDISAGESSGPTGLAVQTNGRILAVAHGRQGVVQLFDKVSGAVLGSLLIGTSPNPTNQLAIAPNGDLWVIIGDSLVRYKALESEPRVASSIAGFSHPLAVAVDPRSDDIILVADGGSSQQVKAFDRNGHALWTYGTPGGYGRDPSVRVDKLWFRFDGTLERTALSVQPDGSFWLVDTANDRMLHVAADRTAAEQIAYIPASYSATADPRASDRVFSNYLEFEAPYDGPLAPGLQGGWRLVRNWLAGIPAQAEFPAARNGGFSGLQTVVTLANGRTYALSGLPGGSSALLELPELGPARFVKTIRAPGPDDSATVLYSDGELGYSHRSGATQTAYRQSLAGFDHDHNPMWAIAPHAIGSARVQPDAPTSGALSPRNPVTSSNEVVYFDPSVDSPNTSIHFHLGAIAVGGGDWIWKVSAAGPIDQPGKFQTKAIDGTVNYGGNSVWAIGRQIVFGYHGEGFTDPTNGRVGEANQFILFHDDGLYIGQFGVPTTRTNQPAPAGVAGNSFSNILVGDATHLHLFHNDESQHGGLHRWTIGNLDSLHELVGSGAMGGTIVVN